MRRYFGTDGVRGVANADLSPELAMQLAQAFIHTLPDSLNNPPVVYIGKDTRRSGDMLEAAMVAGFTSLGCEVRLLGVVPTPAVAWLIRHSDAVGGVMISASHNPAPDNGLKFFNSQGEKLSDAEEQTIEAHLDTLRQIPRPIGAGVGRSVICSRTELRPYLEALKASLPVSLEGIRVLLDTAHGALSFLAPELLQELGVDLTVLNCHPDGMNINAGCGSTHLETLQQAITQGSWDVGIAFDGDGDRCLAVSPEGQAIDGDKILYFCARYLPEMAEEPAVVATVMSNLGFEKALADIGKQLIRTAVGDRYVLEMMHKQRLSLGGEQSGHVIFLKHQVTGDGLLTALQLLSAWKLSGQDWSSLLTQVPSYPQRLENIPVSATAHQSWQDNPVLKAAIAECEAEIQGEGRILVRASGTEPKIRVMVEGAQLEQVETILTRLVSVVEKELGTGIS